MSTRPPRLPALLFGCSLLLLPGVAIAATTPPGVNIRWDNCFADGGAINRTFACDTNTGAEVLVLSFELDTPMADVSGLEYKLDLASASAVLPSWWAFRNAGTCRITALSMSAFPPVTSVNCLDWAVDQEVAALASYTIGYSTPNTARILAVAAVPSVALVALNANQEYFAASLGINHTKTVGTGACGGCDVPVCIVLTSLNVTTPVLANDRRLSQGANGPNSQIAYWQNALASSFDVHCSLTGCAAAITCVLDPTTRAMHSTWGSVKALYR